MKRYRQNDAIAWRHIQDQSVLIDPESGVVFVLNELGGQVWQLLDQTRSPQELAAELRGTLVEPPGRLERDIDQFIASLVERKLAVPTS